MGEKSDSQLRKEFFRGLVRGSGFGVGMAGILLFLGASVLLAVTVSGTINSFSSGDLISASTINTNFTSLKTAIEDIPLGTYCGRSSDTAGDMVDAANYTGVPGFQGGKAICEIICSDSRAHVCTGHELAMSLQRNVTIPNDRSYWYISMGAGLNTVTITDCNGFTSDSASIRGVVFTSITAVIWRPNDQTCDGTFPVACCL